MLIALYTCVNCLNPIQVKGWSESAQLDVLPISVPDIPQNLPENVKISYSEALNCFGVNSWNATAVMCRRTIQEAVVFLNASGPTLFKQIEDLAQKQIIVPDLKDWAHEVRIIGKDGAHADVPDEVTPSDAKDAIEFTSAFLNFLFVIKDKLKSRKAK